jgi:D-galactarolactone isomerase
VTYEYEGQRGPKLSVPIGATDTHMHIYEPGYPMAPTALLSPPSGELADYKKVQQRLGLERVVIVQPTTYGTDNSCTLDTMAKVGSSSRGVVAVDTLVSDQDLQILTDKGITGLRFHMLPGGALPWEILGAMANRINNFGWHIQLQLDGRELPHHINEVNNLPCPLVIDHVGKFLEPVDPDDEAFRMMLGLVESGAWVKLSAAYETSRIGAPYFDDVAILANYFIAAAPERMLWASNWPHPGQSPRPDDAVLMDTLLNWVDNDALRRKILVDNPADLYGFK